MLIGLITQSEHYKKIINNILPSITHQLAEKQQKVLWLSPKICVFQSFSTSQKVNYTAPKSEVYFSISNNHSMFPDCRCESHTEHCRSHNPLSLCKYNKKGRFIIYHAICTGNDFHTMLPSNG